MGIVGELLDFNKVKQFQQYCGIVPCSPSDPDARQAVCSESVPERKNNQKSACYKVTYPWLHSFFMLGSSFGDEIFYITYLPVIYWCFEHFTGARIVQIWVVTMYLGQVLKEILQMPRPTCPPAYPMENQHKAEFGFPSTHATAASSLSFGTLFCLIGRYNVNLPLGYTIATLFTVWVCLSRVYKGMHSLLDIVGGLTVSALYITLGWSYLNDVQEQIESAVFSPLLILVANFCLGWFYPGGNCASRKDTVMILGVGAGVNLATWANHQLAFDYDNYAAPEWHIAFFRILHGIIIIGAVRSGSKNLFSRLIEYCYQPITPANVKSRSIEVPLTFTIYTLLGVSVAFVVPLINAQLGLYQS